MCSLRHFGFAIMAFGLVLLLCSDSQACKLFGHRKATSCPTSQGYWVKSADGSYWYWHNPAFGIGPPISACSVTIAMIPTNGTCPPAPAGFTCYTCVDQKAVPCSGTCKECIYVQNGCAPPVCPDRVIPPKADKK